MPVPPGASEQEREHARYLTAVHFIDSLFGGVLDDLERRKLLDRTVVVVTSDHGMEFDENGLGFTGHSTAYSEYQMHTPLVVRWPGRPPGARHPPDVPQRRGADPADGAVRMHESAVRLLERPQPVLGHASGAGSSPPATATSP